MRHQLVHRLGSNLPVFYLDFDKSLRQIARQHNLTTQEYAALVSTLADRKAEQLPLGSNNALNKKERIEDTLDTSDPVNFVALVCNPERRLRREI